MKVIFVHGRDQQSISAGQLRTNWLTAWQKGLQKSGLQLPPDETIKIPYYAKTLFDMIKDVEQKKSFIDAGHKELLINARRSSTSGINNTKQRKFFMDYLGEIAKATAKSSDDKAQLRNIQDPKRDFLNHEPIQDLLEWIDKKRIFGDLVIKTFTNDVFMYLTQNPIKSAVNDLVLKEFDSEPCVVVGHSLGSIVTYLILKNKTHLDVRKFITIGSPLGVVALSKYLEPPLEMPKSIKSNASDRWYNAYDDLDFVALNPLDKAHFRIEPAIVNSNHVQNYTSNHHGIEGYLEDKIVARAIYDALQ